MYTADTVRRDLRSIARKKASVEALKSTREYLLAQIALMRDAGKDTACIEKRLATAIDATTRCIGETAERDALYIKCVCALTPLHRTLILENYILRVPMWKVAEKVAYSERRAKEHLKQAIDELVAMLNER